MVKLLQLQKTMLQWTELICMLEGIHIIKFMLFEQRYCQVVFLWMKYIQE